MNTLEIKQIKNNDPDCSRYKNYQERDLVAEIIGRFTPVCVYQEEGMDEDDFDEAVREKAVEIYCDILAEMEKERGCVQYELADEVSIDDYDYIIAKFCDRIIEYTA